MTSLTRYLTIITVCLPACGVLSACDGDKSNAAVDSPDSPVLAETDAPEGYYAGSVIIDGDGRTAEGLISADGLIRFRLQGPDILQFAGSAQLQGNELVGSGVLIGENCGMSRAGLFCSASAPATISLRLNRPDRPWQLRGTIGYDLPGTRVAAQLSMTWASQTSGTDGPRPASDRIVAGLYDIDPFNAAITLNSSAISDASLSIDGQGRLFFQSPSTGCTGNGTIGLHSEGHFTAYDIALSIAGCSESFGFLNTEFEGLATGYYRIYDPFDFVTWMSAWLTSIDTSTPAAITIEAFHL